MSIKMIQFNATIDVLNDFILLTINFKLPIIDLTFNLDVSAQC